MVITVLMTEDVNSAGLILSDRHVLYEDRQPLVQYSIPWSGAQYKKHITETHMDKKQKYNRPCVLGMFRCGFPKLLMNKWWPKNGMWGLQSSVTPYHYTHISQKIANSIVMNMIMAIYGVAYPKGNT